MFKQGIGRAALTLACVGAGLGALPALAHADNAREINVKLTNSSDRPLEIAKWELPAGCWSSEPPARIELDATATIRSRSCGVLTGTEFTVEYRVEGTDKRLRLQYNDPYAGSDEYAEHAPAGYLVSRTGTIGEGNEMQVRFGCSAVTCDGIPDEWKRNGVTIDPEGAPGPQFIDLPKMGLELDRPNVLVHLDWMDDGAGSNESIAQAALDRVIQSYDQVPVTFRGASRPGINLVVDHGPNSTIEPGGATWGSLSKAGSIGWMAGLLTGWRDPGYQLKPFYDLVRSRVTPMGRLPIFHYAVAIDRIVPPRLDAAGATEFDNTSGYGVPYGFIVSLGGWDANPTVDQEAGTFMHELGHTLNLIHGGSGEEMPNEEEYKPNYPSVMNYLFQTRGVPRGGTPVFDYSRIDTPDFDETAATEAGGVSLGPNGAGYGTGHRCPKKGGGFDTVTVNVLAPVDWSCDAATDGTGFDVNGDGRETTLKGSTSDWSRLKFMVGPIGAGANPDSQIPATGETGPSDEITKEEDAQIAGLDTAAPQTTLQRDPAANADGWNNGPVTLTFSAADGDGSGVARTEVAIDLGGYQEVTGPVVLADEGIHTVSYRSVDRAQNVEAAHIELVRIDKTDPGTTATLDPEPNAAGWANGATTVRISATDALSGVRSVTLSSTGAVTTAEQTVSGDAASLLVDRDGITTVRHHATDKADNSNDAGEVTVKTDATPPSSTIDHRENGATVIHRDEFVSGTASDATSGVERVRLTYTPLFRAVQETTTVLADLSCTDEGRTCTWKGARPPHPGPWLVEAVAMDLAGNAEPDGPSARVVITG